MVRIVAMPFAIGIGALQAGIASLLTACSIVGLRPQENTYHTLNFIVGAVAGGVLGAAFCWQERHQKGYMICIWTRPALLNCGVASCQLALFQPHAMTRAALLIWGVFVLAAGSAAVIPILFEKSPIEQTSSRPSRRQRWQGTVTYLLIGATIVLVDIYWNGRRTLTLSREAGGVTATLETYRWFGRTHTETRTLDNVREWRYAFNEGPGIVIVAAAGEMYIQGDLSYDTALATQVQGSLNEFVASSATRLELSERTGFPLWALVLGAVGLWVAGLLWDPLFPSRYKGLVGIRDSGD